MAADNNLILQASTTKAATFNGAATSLPGGTPRRGLKARVIYSAAANASGANSVTFTIEEAATSGGTYYALASAARQVVNLTTTAQAGELFIPFETSQPYVRLTATFGGAGGSPTITYQGDVTLSRP